MLRAIVFHGKKQFTAEYYANEIRHRSYGSSQDNGYYKGYGNELRYAVISDRTFRLNSGLFLVQGRQCAVVLGTSEDILVPAQEEAIKGYIIARINTNVLAGDNVEITYKLGTSSAYPSLTQENTYNISENTSAIYELPLYSFTIYRSITNVTMLIPPVKNMQVQIDSVGSSSPSDYLFEDALYIKYITEVDGKKYYEFYKNDGSLSRMYLNDLRTKADLVNGKIPVSQLPDVGITADYAKALSYGNNQTISGQTVADELSRLGVLTNNQIALLQSEYAKVSTDGAIAHMEDLEYYGSRPAILSANFIEDWSTWRTNKSTYSSGNISPAGQRVDFLPTGSNTSVSEARAEYISGTTDFVECRVNVLPSSSYATINFFNINTTHPVSGSGSYAIYGPDIVNQSSGSNYRSKSTTFKVTIKDMYGHIYTKNYTINYAIHYTQE